MRFAGIDIGSERHAVAIVDEGGALLQSRYLLERKPPGTGGFALCWETRRLPRRNRSNGTLLENLVAWLVGKGFAITLLNPIRTRRFAEEELQRTKTDSVDASDRAIRGAEASLQLTQLSDHCAQELRDLVHLRERTIQHVGDRVRDLHQAIDLRHSQSLPVTFAVSTRRLLPLSCLVIPRRALILHRNGTHARGDLL